MRTTVLTVLVVCLLSVGIVSIAWSAELHADRVLVLKKERTLKLLNRGKVIKTYRVALGGEPIGAKTRQGDHRTPEGLYVLDHRNAHSQFHKAIHISYPSARDRSAAREHGVSPGGDVFLHGLPNGYGYIGAAHRLKDWTDGCIAVTNDEIEEIWLAVPDGTPIEIRPERFMNKVLQSLPDWLTVLNREVIGCTRCPRLVVYRQQVAQEKRRAYRDWEYWGKPVPGFGDPNARVLIMGLAPGAHGSNRTGRPFTGDASGKFMYPVLYETGFASQPNADSRDDGMKLTDLYITAAVRCAPPDNKPLPQELAQCAPFLDREIDGLKRVKVIVALGKIGFDAYLNAAKRHGGITDRKAYIFKHGAKYRFPDGKVLLASYHPSNQNTQTGKLTREMFVKIFQEAARLADDLTGQESGAVGQ